MSDTFFTNGLHWRATRPRELVCAPQQATLGSAGWDLRAAEAVVLAPGEPRLVGTGVAVWLGNLNLVGLLTLRSGFALRSGAVMPNGVGIIDPDYQGELMVPLMAVAKEVAIEVGQRFAQLTIVPLAPLPKWIEVSRFPDFTERGEGGFGSTGRM